MQAEVVEAIVSQLEEVSMNLGWFAKGLLVNGKRRHKKLLK